MRSFDQKLPRHLRSQTGRVRPRTLALLGIAAVLTAGALWAVAKNRPDDSARAPSTAPRPAAVASRPALTVTTTTPQRTEWPRILSANGNVTAWQEAIVGAELHGLRLTEVQVDVGSVVKKGQVLARLQSDTVAAELAQAKAAAAEAEAALGEARANAERGRQLEPTGTISKQQYNRYITAEQTAKAQLVSAQAKVHAEEVRLAQTRILAPDDGVISARSAAVGTVVQSGQELFRLVRGGRVEWRAEVTAAELARVKPGMRAALTAPSGAQVAGVVRMVAPTVDPQTRNGLVYVDLPAQSEARAGMFARGEIDIGQSPALTLPQGAVVLRDGFSYVFRVGPDGRVTQVKVDAGRRVGDRIEILAGLAAQATVVDSGAGFLADGDLVRVAAAPQAPAAGATAGQDTSR
jgi:RND family efflux transporter MFP subunit